MFPLTQYFTRGSSVLADSGACLINRQKPFFVPERSCQLRSVPDVGEVDDDIRSVPRAAVTTPSNFVLVWFRRQFHMTMTQPLRTVSVR